MIWWLVPIHKSNDHSLLEGSKATVFFVGIASFKAAMGAGAAVLTFAAPGAG